MPHTQPTQLGLIIHLPLCPDQPWHTASPNLSWRGINNVANVANALHTIAHAYNAPLSLWPWLAADGLIAHYFGNAANVWQLYAPLCHEINPNIAPGWLFSAQTVHKGTHKPSQSLSTTVQNLLSTWDTLIAQGIHPTASRLQCHQAFLPQCWQALHSLGITLDTSLHTETPKPVYQPTLHNVQQPSNGSQTYYGLHQLAQPTLTLYNEVVPWSLSLPSQVFVAVVSGLARSPTPLAAVGPHQHPHFIGIRNPQQHLWPHTPHRAGA